MHFIVIDEIHLLHDDRGLGTLLVVEGTVPRTATGHADCEAAGSAAALSIAVPELGCLIDELVEG